VKTSTSSAKFAIYLGLCLLLSGWLIYLNFSQPAWAAQEQKAQWPMLERQLTVDRVIPGSALDKLIRDNQDFSILHPQEASDKLGIPPWLRVHWRKLNPDWRYSPSDPTGNYPRGLKYVYRWMLTHQDFKAGPSETSEQKTAVVGPNLRISGAQTTWRSESNISVNYLDPTKIVAASNSGSSDGRQAQFYSTDAGATWGQTTLPLVSSDLFHSDPIVGWTSDGRAWSGTLAIGIRGSSIYLEGRAYVSTDNGQTWTFDGTFSGSQTSMDKPMMWIDHSPSSSFRNNIYVTYHNGAPAYMNRRTSTGWQSPIRVSGAETTGTGIGGDVKTNSAGDVFGFWPDTGSGKIFVVKSTNGGVSYSSPTQVATTFDTYDIGVPAQSSRRVLIYTTTGAYRTSTKNLVYAAWNDLSGEADCTRSGDEPGSNVASPCKARIWFSRSTDGGATWSPKVMINNQSGLNDQFNPWLVVDERTGNLGIIYYDTVGDPGRKKVDTWYQASSNDGAGWNPPVKVTTAQSDETVSGADSGNQFGDYNGLSGINGIFFPAWTDRRSNAREEIWTAKVTDNFTPEPFVLAAGTTFTGENCAPANNIIEPGERVAVNFSLRNTGSANVGNLTATLQATGGVTSPTGPQNYGALAAGGPTVARSFTFTANGECGGTLTATLQLQDGTTNLGAVTFTFTLGAPRVTFTENFDGVTAPALPSGWTSTVATGSASRWVTSTTSVDTTPNSAFVANPATIADVRLESPAIAITAPAAQLSFSNNYSLEAGFLSSGARFGFDGGVLEIAIGSGAFTDITTAGGSFVTGGYNETIYGGFGNPLGGRRGWSGISFGFISTVVNLPAAAAGQNIKLRWRMGSDSDERFDGWWIDNVRITNGVACLSGSSCGGQLCPVITINPATLPAGALLTPYNQTLTASGGVAPYTFTLNAGALPNGLTLSSAGGLSGTPTQGGVFNFTVRVRANDGCLGERNYSLSIPTPILVDAGSEVTAENCTPQNSVIDPGEVVIVNFSLRNTGTVNAANLVATLQATGGVTTPGGPQTYGAMTAGGAAVTRPFRFRADPALTCGSTLTATLQLQDGTINLGTVTFTLPVGGPKTAFSENFDGVAAPALPPGWTATIASGSAPWVTSTTSSDTAPNNAFAANPSSTSDIRLDSPSINITTASAQLSFRNNYNTEPAFDGGLLEIALGTGAFTDILAAGGSFVAGGYNQTLITLGRQAWSGDSLGYITTTVNLPASAAGRSIRLRWRMTTDSSVSDVGWRIDTIRITDGLECATSCVGEPCPRITISPASLPAGTLNTAYSQTLTASGGATPYSFALSAGTLPNGLTLSSTGALSGTPTQGGAFDITVRATDASGCSGTRSYRLVINCPAITFAPTSLPAGIINTAYNQTITAIGGAAPYSFAVTAGALPGGLTLAAGGAISGTPNIAGTFSFTVTATDASNCTGTGSYSLSIGVLPGAQSGVLYVLNNSVSGNRIYGYAVNETTGALGPLPGFPISTGGVGVDLFISEHLTIDRANQRLYAINGGSNTVSAYTINPTTGALTPLPFNPINLGSGSWVTIAAHPSGSPLVIGDGNIAGRLASYQITATTATAAAGSPFSTGSTRPVSTVFSQDGAYVYTGANSNTSAAGFSVNATTGVLTALAGSPFNFGGTTSLAYATDSAGRIFAANYNSGLVRAFTTANGVPSPVSGNPFTSGLTQTLHGLLHPNGFYLVADRIDFFPTINGRVGVYRVNGSGSATTLTAVTGSPFSSGGLLTTILALNQAGSLLFAANGDSRNLTTFGVNPTTGALTSLSTQTANTQGTSGRLTGMAYLSPSQCPTIALSPATLPAGTVGAAYNQTLTASGGATPHSFTLSAGTLPNGLTLSSAGALSGTPTQSGSFNITVRATDANNCSGTQSYTLTINCQTITINPATLPAGVAGAAYNQTLTQTGGVGNVAFSLSAGTLPTGLTLSPAGVLSGTTTQTGNFPITVRATDANGCTGTRNYTLVINQVQNPVPVISSLSPNTAVAGSAAFTLTVNGSGFVDGATVRWNNNNRPTTFVNGGRLTATIPLSDILNEGTANVTVFNPEPGGGPSNAMTFNITRPPAGPRTVRVAPATGSSGANVVVPIELVSQGDENALGFSLTFDQAILGAPQAALGADAAGATLNTNASQAAQGRFGAILALPSGGMFSAGTRRIVNVTFTIANTQAASTNIGFGDQPIPREVSNANASPLPANYTPGVVTITSGYEADVAPRPNGDETVTVIDWVQLGRFVAGLDTAANGSEFQRADCAPRADKGDGRLTASDWAQAGRYAAGLDPVVTAGGPTSPVSVTTFASMIAARAVKSDEPRLLRIIAGDHLLGATRTVVVELDAQGDESALGFSLRFNPSEWRFVSAEAGRDAQQAVIHLNANEAARGRLGLVLALPASGRFSAGARQIVALKFAPVSGPRAKPLAIGFADEPVSREVVSGEAFALPARYEVKSTSPNVGALANVSAASLLAGELAAGQIVTAFGENLAPATQTAASLPLPLELAGVRVLVTDSHGVERLAPLFFVSLAQINYLLPEEMAEGVATVRITNSEGAVSLGVIEVAAPAPSLFTANADGQGVAAAVALRVRSDGSQSFEPVAQFDAAQGRFVASPIDLGREGDEVFLLLFGTGLRGGRAENVTASIGRAKVEVLFAGPQGGMAGLDQINLRLPRSLTGRGEVDVALMIDRKPANLVRISLR